MTNVKGIFRYLKASNMLLNEFYIKNINKNIFYKKFIAKSFKIIKKYDFF